MTCSWVKAGTGSGSGTVSGATNGLHLINSGTTVALGGNLTSGTTINGQGLYALSINNVTEFQVSTSGSSTLLGIDDNGFLFSFTGGSVSFDDNGGLKYGSPLIPLDGTYLVDADYVTGQTANLQAEIDYISGVTDTKLPIIIFSAYTGTTNTRLNIIETDYVSGATNGLTKYACHDVCLGGTLSTPIIFNGSNTNHLCYGGDYSLGYNNRSIPDKEYVDTVALGLQVHAAAMVTTTGSNIALSGTPIVDGIQTVNGWRILVRNQTSGATNGIYIVNSGGTWSRSSDYNFNPPIEISNGDLIPVLTGNTYRNTLWVLTTQDPIVSGDTLTFSPFSTPGNYVGGTGIDVSGSTISINSAVMSVINSSITGATNAGAGTTIYSGTTSRNLVLNTIKGSGGTSVQKVGDEIIVCSTTASGSQQYSGETPSAVNLCGITIGYQLTGKTVSQIIQDLLVPELFQTSVGTPSTSVAATLTGTLEIGCSFSQTITPTYTAGAITPLYQSTSPFTRGGAANDYSYAGPSLSTGFFGCTSCVINPYVVTSGVQTWTVCTKYDAGSCIKGSKGTVNPSYPTICPLNSCTANGTATITGILPWFWGTSASGTITASIVTGGTKTVAVVGASTPITFNAVTQYLWFAAPTGTYTTKTKWWVCAANAGIIGGTGELWKQQGTVAVTCGSKWVGCSFDVYVTCGITTTAAGIPMCLYY